MRSRARAMNAGIEIRAIDEPPVQITAIADSQGAELVCDPLPERVDLGSKALNLDYVSGYFSGRAKQVPQQNNGIGQRRKHPMKHKTVARELRNAPQREESKRRRRYLRTSSGLIRHQREYCHASPRLTAPARSAIRRVAGAMVSINNAGMLSATAV